MQPSSPGALEQILAFSRRYPTVCFHIIDMPYRLSSPAAQDPANRHLWLDETGEVTAFAVAQLPFSTLDWAVRPGSEELQTEIVDWGVARLIEIATSAAKALATSSTAAVTRITSPSSMVLSWIIGMFATSSLHSSNHRSLLLSHQISRFARCAANKK